MKLTVIIVVGVVVFIGLVVVIGALSPRGHTASRTLRLRRSPAAVWTLITDVDAFTSWRSSMKGVERLPDRDGRPAWVEHVSGMDIPIETIESRPPQRLVLRITDPKLPFGGTWTYVIVPIQDGSTLMITEDGSVTNPVFRFMSRFVFGHHATHRHLSQGRRKKVQ